MTYTIKQVADMAGVTVRTLHHYDQIGLLKPKKVETNGYRIYSDADLARLQQILFFREFGFDLRSIGAIIDGPNFDRVRALQSHRSLLLEQRERLSKLIETIDQSIAAMNGDRTMASSSMFEGFDRSRIEEQIERYHDEAVARWGQKTVNASENRVRNLTPEIWDAISRETSDINQTLAALMKTSSTDSPEVQQQVQRWYDLLNRYFSDYSPEVFGGLGDLYVDDPRFTAHYDTVSPGLAAYLRDGMRIWADRKCSDS